MMRLMTAAAIAVLAVAPASAMDGDYTHVGTGIEVTVAPAGYMVWFDGCNQHMQNLPGISGREAVPGMSTMKLCDVVDVIGGLLDEAETVELIQGDLVAYGADGVEVARFEP